MQITLRLPDTDNPITFTLRTPTEAEMLAAETKRWRKLRGELRDKSDDGDEEVASWVESITGPVIALASPTVPTVAMSGLSMEELKQDAPALLDVLHKTLAECFADPQKVTPTITEVALAKRVAVFELDGLRLCFKRISYDEAKFLDSEPEYLKRGGWHLPERYAQLAKARLLRSARIVPAVPAVLGEQGQEVVPAQPERHEPCEVDWAANPWAAFRCGLLLYRAASALGVVVEKKG